MLGGGLPEAGHRNLASSALSSRGARKNMENCKNADRSDGVNPKAASHTHLPFGVTLPAQNGRERCRKRQTSVLATALTVAKKSLSAYDDFVAVRQLDGFRGAFGRSVLARNGPDGYGLPDIGSKVGSDCPGPFHRDGGSTFKGPGGYFAGGILRFDPEVCVRILPLELGKSAGDVNHLAPVILRLKSVMCEDRQRIGGKGKEQQ